MEKINMGSLLNQYITNQVNGLFTAIPCVVQGQIDMATQRVDVRPLVNRVTTDGESRELSPILGVPVVFPASKTSQFSFPISAGDTVLCVFSQRSIARFKLGEANPADPIDFGKYSKNDAIAIPGLFTFPDAKNDPAKRTWSHSTDDAVLVHNIGSGSECEVRLKSGGDVIINTPGKAEVNCDTSVVNASTSATIDTPETTVTGNLTVNGNLQVDQNSTVTGNSTVSGDLDVTGSGTLGSATINGIQFSTHTHTGVQSGTDTSGPPS